MTSTAFDDGMEDWERELNRPDGYPFIVIPAGVVAIVIVAVLAFNVVAVEVADHVVATLGVAMIVAALVFGLGWLLNLRYATLGWNVIAGGVFAGTALMCVAVVLAIGAAGTLADARAAQMIKINSMGEPVLPPGIKGGPITAAAMDFVRATIDERHRREKMSRDLGLDRIANAAAVAAEPGLIRDCGRFAKAMPGYYASEATVRAAAQRFRDKVTKAVKDAGQRDGMLRGFDKGFGSSVNALREENRVADGMMAQAATLCTLLGARRWRPQGNAFLFYTRDDLAAFDRAITPWNESVRRLDALAAESQTRMRDAGMIDDNSRL